MKETETDLRAFVQHCEQITVPGVVLGRTHLAVVRHALALHDKLSAALAKVAELEQGNARLRREVEETKLELSELRGTADAALAYVDTSLPSGRELAFELGQLLKHGVDDLTKRLALDPGAAVEYLKAKESKDG